MDRHRDPSLDSVRALAALAILVFHVLTVGLASHDLGVFGPVVNRLDIGVPVFFVLSGFLIYAPFVVSAGRRPRISTYAMRRFLRIVPAYWVALAFASGPTHPWTIFDAGQLRYTFFGQAYSEDTIFLGIGAAWSLCTEVAFYAMVPVLAWVLFAAGVRLARTEVCVLLGLAAASLMLRPWLWDAGRSGLATGLLLTNLWWFTLGMLLAIARVHRSRGTGVCGVEYRRAALRHLVRSPS